MISRIISTCIVSPLRKTNIEIAFCPVFRSRFEWFPHRVLHWPEEELPKTWFPRVVESRIIKAGSDLNIEKFQSISEVFSKTFKKSPVRLALYAHQIQKIVEAGSREEKGRFFLDNKSNIFLMRKSRWSKEVIPLIFLWDSSGPNSAMWIPQGDIRDLEQTQKFVLIA